MNIDVRRPLLITESFVSWGEFDGCSFRSDRAVGSETHDPYSSIDPFTCSIEARIHRHMSYVARGISHPRVGSIRAGIPQTSLCTITIYYLNTQIRS